MCDTTVMVATSRHSDLQEGTNIQVRHVTKLVSSPSCIRGVAYLFMVHRKKLADYLPPGEVPQSRKKRSSIIPSVSG